MQTQKIKYKQLQNIYKSDEMVGIEFYREESGKIQNLD